MSEVSLKEYFDIRLNDCRYRCDSRFEQADSAVTKAERTMNERLNSMNEFREALKDQANRMATREELKPIMISINELKNARANLEGRLGILAAGVSLVISIALWAIHNLISK